MENEAQANDPNDIFFYQPDKPKIETTSIFRISTEGSRLQVQAGSLHYLFSKLNKDTFDDYYNQFRAYLNFDFSPVDFENATHVFSDREKTALEQKLICTLLYFFTSNNFKKILIRRQDFIHPFQIKEMLWLINDMYGKDNPNNLKIGSHIFKINYSNFLKIVEENNRWTEMW